jgi:hypothetical protein
MSHRASLLSLVAAGCWLAAGTAQAAGPHAGRSDSGREVAREHRQFDVPTSQVLRIELQYGELTLTTGGSNVDVELVGHCSRGGDGCERRLAEIALASDSHGGEFDVRVEGLPKLDNHGMHAELRVRVPEHQRVAVHMGAGEVKIDDVTQDLRVELGAGDIDIHMPESAVRSVDLEAGVGDAALRRARGLIESERDHLIGAQVHWNDGHGAADVDVHVGAGDIDLCLDE